jgi:hypothetical protein
VLVQRVATAVRDLPRPNLPPHRWTHPRIDHLKPHIHGGPTTAGNSQALAKNAHALRDHPGVHVTLQHYQHQPPDDTGPPGRPPGGPPDEAPAGRPDTTLEHLSENARDIEWTLPTGHRYTTEPPPALGHGSTAPTTRSVMELELTLMAQRATAKG